MSTTMEAIDWAVIERGAGDPLLLLHGFTGAAASWDEHLDVLAAQLRVIAPDPGLLARYSVASPSSQDVST